MSQELIDVNVSLSRWPTRRLPLDEAPRLVERLRSLGVVEAWASSFDGLLHKDLAGVNARLFEECRAGGDGFFSPFGVVNPMLAEWPDDLRRCQELHGMRGVRLFPNYHGYAIAEPALSELLAMASERKLIVQLAVRLEDSRTQPRRLTAADVDLAPLAALVAQHAELRLVVLGGLNVLAVDVVDSLAATGRVCFDIAALEGVGALERLLTHAPPEQILFGTHAPFFAAESAVLKLHESNVGEALSAAIRFDNARRLLPANA